MDDVTETLARILDRTGDYRILRRVRPPEPTTVTGADRRRSGLATGIVLDTETTGLTSTDEVIELGMAAFAYDPHTSRIDHLIGTFSALRDPGRPIPPEVSRLTGLSDADLAGRTIEAAAVDAFMAEATLVIAHNAAFDRPFAERAWPVFAGAPWACSLSQVDWRAEGAEGARLTHLLAARGLFHDGHRALDDCLALLHLLGLPLRSGPTAFATILAAAQRAGVRLWAAGAPFDRKDVLKAAGYRWCDGTNGAPRSWHREVPEDAVDEEVAFLRAHVYRDPAATPLRTMITSHDRFSARALIPQR